MHKYLFVCMREWEREFIQRHDLLSRWGSELRGKKASLNDRPSLVAYSGNFGNMTVNKWMTNQVWHLLDEVYEAHFQ